MAAPDRDGRARSRAPWLVLTATLALAALGAAAAAANARAQDEARFANAVQSAQDRIEARLETYVALLRGGAALFAASDDVTREEFRRFVERLRVAELYPGVQGIGFTMRILPEEIPMVEEAMRAEGVEGFRVWPADPRPEYHSILFLEPLDPRNRAALGFDMFTESTRRDTMTRARDSGQASLSGKVTLVQEIDAEKQSGFLIYVPVYRAGSRPDSVQSRRENLLGFVYSPFRADDLFANLFGTEAEPRVTLSVYDGRPSPETLLHASPVAPGHDEFSAAVPLQIAGRTWTIVYHPAPAFRHSGTRWVAPVILGVGLSFALVLFAFTSRLLNAQRKALAASAEATSQRNRLQTIFEEVPALVAVLEATEARYILANRPYRQLFGNRPLVGLPIRQALPELSGQGFIERVEEVLRTGEPRVGREMPARFDRGAGRLEEGFFNFSFQPLHGPSGAVEGMIIFAVEVTELVRSRRTSEEARQIAETLSALALVFTSELDPERIVQRVVDEATRLIDAGAGVYVPLSGGGDRALRPAADTDPAAFGSDLRRSPLFSHLSTRGAVLSADAPGSALLSALAPSGMRSLLAVAVRSHRGTLGALVFGHPEPDRFHDAHRQLVEGMAAQAAVALDNAHLYRAAQEAVRLRDEFLSVASHELKTPLTPLQLRLEVLLRTAAKAPPTDFTRAVQEAVQTAQRQVLRLGRLVADLLDVSRITAGRLALERAEVDLTSLAHETVDRLAPQAERAHTPIRLEAPGPVVGRWDAFRLEQVLTNLLENAIKYGAGKPVELRVGANNGSALLSVTDFGIGIDPEKLPRIFDRFERGVSERHYGGLGLGLYISRQIVRAHGGEIRARSEPGVKTVVEVTLPIAQA